jgi:hypothetical protein
MSNDISPAERRRRQEQHEHNTARAITRFISDRINTIDWDGDFLPFPTPAEIARQFPGVSLATYARALELL